MSLKSPRQMELLLQGHQLLNHILSDGKFSLKPDPTGFEKN
jgi:hypothetical protein